MDQPIPATNSAVPPPPPGSLPPTLPPQPLPPPMVAKGTPPGPVPGSPPSGEPPLQEPPPEYMPRPSFWQQPWVQNILPFATSLTLHAAIIVIGVVLAAVG